ncbi:hypothetical protein RI367_005147 [Sorochytrium milnesiophthora]
MVKVKKDKQPKGDDADVFTNLHGSVGKTAVSKVLTALADRGDITSKQFNKTIVFVANQDDDDCPTPEEMEQMELELVKLKDETAKLKDETKQLQTQLTDLTSSLPDDEAQKRLDHLEIENEELESRLHTLRNGGKLIEEADRKRVDADLIKMKKLWASRRRTFKDIFSAITENLPQKPSEFMEELGIETDEQVGVDMATVTQGI